MKLISSSAARRERLHHVPNSHLPLAFEIVEVNDLMQSGTQLQQAKTKTSPEQHRRYYYLYKPLARAN